MIDIEKCGACTNVCELLQLGLGQEAVNAVAAAANFGAEANCGAPPEQMPGGWMRCHAAYEVGAGMRGAAAAIEHLGIQAIEPLVCTEPYAIIGEI